MDWLAFAFGVAALSVVPLGYGIVFLRRRRTRALVRHDTTPPTAIVNTGQRR